MGDTRINNCFSFSFLSGRFNVKRDQWKGVNLEVQVARTVNSAKRKADKSRNEAPMGLNDLIAVGVFSDTKEHLKPPHMEKQWFKTDSSTVAFVVFEKLTFAGIDPL
jgi:hypothetical protein